MDTDSVNSLKMSTKKIYKTTRTKPDICRKIVALNELKQVQMSERQIAAIFKIPNSTMHSWKENLNLKKSDNEELSSFFKTRVGMEFLQRAIMAAYMTIHYGHGGIRSLQEFIKLSGLEYFVASSEGALQEFVVRNECHIINFGSNQEKQLVKATKPRKITAGLDEMFRGGNPCLVAIDLLSGYILLEKFTEDRTAETWKKELKPRLDELNVELDQVASDSCGAICSFTKEMGATHIPELFHAQFEITKATAAGLSSQEKGFAIAVEKSKKELQRISKKNGPNSKEAAAAQVNLRLRELGHKQAEERCMKVKIAKKELGKIHNPINLTTGKLQTADIVKEGFKNQLGIIKECAREADLSQSCMKRLDKSERTFDLILRYVVSFFLWYRIFIDELALDKEKELFFEEVIIPLCYLQMILSRKKRKEREELQPLMTRLTVEFEAAQYSHKEKMELMEKGKLIAEKYQRSTSCVEGRNGELSLYHHRFCRLGVRSCKALTVVRNFHVKQSNETTAARRFFGNKHEILFESLVQNVRIPSMPKKQYHDPQKRKGAWEKRRSKQRMQSAA